MCRSQRSSDPVRRTDPVLRRPSHPEEEDNQWGGQQLPDEQNHPEHDVTGVSQWRPQVSLETQGQRSEVTGLTRWVSALRRPHLVWDVVPVEVKGVDGLDVGEGEHHQVVTGSRRVQQHHRDADQSHLTHRRPLQTHTCHYIIKSSLYLQST